MKKYIAELLGTFCLSFLVTVTVKGGVELPLATPLLAALTVGLFVYTVGHISGTHLNPAVTLGALSVKKISPTDAGIYIIVQLIAAIGAFSLVQYLFPGFVVPTETSFPSVCLGEFFGTFILGFGIASVVFGKISDATSGVVIGGSLLLGICLASPFSPGILNPAVALALNAVTLKMVICQCLGGVAGFNVYRMIKG